MYKKKNGWVTACTNEGEDMKYLLRKGVMMAAGCALVFGLSACGISENSENIDSGKNVNLNDYVQVVFEGYDGYGVAEVVFDEEKFEQDNPKLKDKNESVVDYIEFGSINWNIDVTEGLSNGEKVTLTWECNEKSIKETTGYILAHENMVVTVDGLDEVETFDAFEGLEVRFEGVNRRGTAAVVTSNVNEKSKRLPFVLDKNRNLSNGDVVTVKIDLLLDDVESCIEICGAVPVALEKQYTVEGLGTYVAEMSQIPEETMMQMDAQAREIMQQHVDEMWGENEEFKGMEHLGNYLLVQKEDGLNDKNKLFLVYKNTVANDDYPEGLDFYYYALYKNIIVESGGTCTIELAAASVPEGDFSYYIGSTVGESFSVGNFWYYGFADLETLFSQKIAPELDEYDYVSTVQEQWASEGPVI